MITPGIGYTYTNSPDGFALLIDQATPATLGAFQAFEDSTAEGVSIIRITPGTINNQFPTVNGVQVGLPLAYLAAPNSSSYVVLNIPNSSSAYPSSQSTITISANNPESDNDNGRIAIAFITVQDTPGAQKSYTVFNNLRGSLSGTRFSDAVGTIIYFFSGI
jgi:hypothetical protein